MDIVSLSPLRTGSVVWQPRRGSWVMTAVCKATYTLLPGVAELAPEQEYPNEDDNHWNDDPARSLHSPSDLVPFKPRADVMLVGHAFAPRNEPVRSLVARVLVGEADKSIEVFADRAFAPDGSVHDTARFTRMSLRWERAAGGPDTSNPVGVRPDARPDTFGMMSLPSLQKPGILVQSPRDVVEPIGFGPIAWSWPERRERLGRHAAAWAQATWSQKPLPEDVDPAFFNAAPRDQQIDGLRSNERIVLEHLHPDYERLVTSLPGHTPRAFVERRGASPQEIVLVADTLWIDTDRGLCTVTWRAQIPIDHPAQAGRILVGLAEPGERLAWSDLERLAEAQEMTTNDMKMPPSLDGYVALPTIEAALPRALPALPFVQPTAEPAPKAEPPPPPSRRNTDPLSQTYDEVIPSLAAALPFGASSAPPPAVSASPPWPAPPAPPAQPSGDATPSWLMQARPATPSGAATPPFAAPPLPMPPPRPAPTFGPPPSTPPGPPPLPPPPLPAPALAPPPLPTSSLASSSLPAPSLPAPSHAAPPPLSTPPLPAAAHASAPAPSHAPPPAPSHAPPPLPAAALAPSLPAPSLPAPSHAPPPLPATALAPSLPAPSLPAPSHAPSLPAPSLPAPSHTPPPLPATALAPSLPPAPSRSAPSQPAPPVVPPPRPNEMRPRAIIDLLWFDPTVIPRILRAWKATLDAQRSKAAGSEEDDRRAVAAILTRGEPLAPDELGDAIAEAVDGDGLFTPPLVLLDGDLVLSLEHDDESAPLDPRRYPTRIVFGGTCVAGVLLSTDDDGPGVPAYLPEPVSARLPLFRRYRARLIAEAHLAQDEREASPVALRVVAIARAVPFESIGQPRA
ncbi:putative outer membrane autotransporter barrel [Minicystis rosea]|nr:putative outer membrane autotransporter barrel [Minicystis rosea]